MSAAWIAFLLYAALAIGLGWRVQRRTADPASYWTAGRQLPGSAVGLSISAGFMSVSWSCVYAVQLFYWYGLGALWLITIPWLLSLWGIYLLARRYHALPAFSQPEMVGQRFGPGARKAVALSLTIVFLVWGGAEMYVAATLLAPGLDIPVPTLIIIIGLIVGIYSAMGGFGAVVATDKMQYVLVGLYILAMGWLALQGISRLPEGWPGIHIAAARSGQSWTSLLSPGLAVIALTFIGYLPGWIFETDLWLRVQAARDAQAARRGVVIAGVSALLFVGLLPLVIGIAALGLFPLEAGAIPALAGTEGDAIFAALVTRYAPAWLAVLVAVGLVAAAMSTIDTSVNVMALSIGYDLLSRGPAATAGTRSRWVTIAATAGTVLFALNTQSLWDIFYLSSGILTTAVAFPVAAIFMPKVRKAGVAASSLAGLAGILLAYFLEVYGPLKDWEPAWLADTGLGFILWGILAATAGYLVGGRSAAARRA